MHRGHSSFCTSTGFMSEVLYSVYMVEYPYFLCLGLWQGVKIAVSLEKESGLPSIALGGRPT